MKRPTTYRLAVDVGGTFTDAVLINEATGTIETDKILSTPHNPSVAFLEVAERLTTSSGVRLEQLAYVMHATTTATNAILERRGAPAGLVITHGFRDVLEIQRQVRHELYNLQTEKPIPLIARRHCLEVPERIDFRGEVVLPLDEGAVARAGERFRAEGINSIAICFLHAYVNAAHELRAAEILSTVHPQASLSLSSQIAPEIREYWRASTTVVNAYIAPVVRHYLSGIEDRLRGSTHSVELHVMQSNGGVMTAAVAKDRPINMIESGPAAGVKAAAHIAGLSGYRNAISFDMGGTTAKMGLIRDGQPTVLPEFEVGGGSGSGSALAKGSGYPILASVIDLVEVGAGGGSVGWVDTGGLLRVGPRSAGADPGPASYGRNGTEPTITDANLLLGRLSPEYFLGGRLRLDCEAAELAVRTRCAKPLQMNVVTAAVGMIDIANATMGEAVRLVTVQRGYDPREFCLVAFGGAGPLHANALAVDLGIPVVLVPPSPGVASSFGMLVSDLRHDYRATRIQPLKTARLDELNHVLTNFQAEADRVLETEGIPAERIVLQPYLDVRYIGQSWKMTVPLDNVFVTVGMLSDAKSAFDRLHEVAYGYCAPEEPAEIVTIGLLATGLIEKVPLRQLQRASRSAAAAHKAERAVFFQEASGFVTTHVYDREGLRPGNLVEGPAVIEGVDSTVLVHPGYVAEVREFGVLALRRRHEAD